MGGCFSGVGLIAKPKKGGSIKVGYWGIRGLGAPLRMILEYAGTDYVDKQYSDPNEWFKMDKPEILKANPLANLPYLVDGDVVVCQTNAVMDYLGDRFGLSGTSMEERRLCRQLLAEVYDLRNTIISLVYNFAEKCRNEAEFMEKMAQHVSEGYKVAYGKLEAFYSMKWGPYALGTKPCIADFHMWEMLDQHEIYAQKLGKSSPLGSGDFPTLTGLHEAVKALPQLQKYFASDSYGLTCNALGISYTSKLLSC